MAASGRPARSADGRLRPACRLALDVARAGGLADRPVQAPPAIIPILGFRRLGATAYETVERVVEDDEGFRQRVAAVADEAAVGRAGWLWLARPEGWSEDPAWRNAAGPPPSAKRSDKADVAVERHRRMAEQAEARRRRTAEQLSDARREGAEARRRAEELTLRLEHLETERNRAMRAAKSLEQDLAVARRDLRKAREVTIDAEAELLRLRSATTTASSPGAGADSGAHPDLAAVSDVVAAAAEAAEAMGRSLSAAAAELSSASAGAGPGPGPRSPTSPGGSGRDRARRRRGARRARRPPALPPGVFDGTAEAHRHLLASGEALVLVDGYNVARAAWSGLSPEEDRRRVVGLLEAVQARSGGRVTVVFDGDSDTVAPVASRSVRVLFSATGVTADDDIAALLAGLPETQPVVVVSSDREVAADARRHGAAVISSRDFLAAARR